MLTIVAESAQQALLEVHRQLGPDAIIVHLRKIPAAGLGALFRKPQIEVTATVPTTAASGSEKVTQLNQRVQELERQLAGTIEASAAAATARPEIISPRSVPRGFSGSPSASSHGLMASATILQNLGLLPMHLEWLADRVRTFPGATAPRNLREELALVQEVLVDHAYQLARRHEKPGNPVRVFIGTPGTGKTTCLCKWLTQEVFLGGRPAQVWRLDGAAPNTAEFLSVHGEILNVPVERVWAGALPDENAARFVDLPGVAVNDPAAFAALKTQATQFVGAELFLVLNASYDLSLLLAHTRAFTGLPLSGIIFTHIDEETRLGKIWNVMLSAQLPVMWLSGGQNIPGQFTRALPEMLFEALVNQNLKGE